MTTTLTRTNDIDLATPSGAVDVRARRLVVVAAIAGIAGGLAATLVAVVAKAGGVPLEAAPKSADRAQAIPMSGFMMGTLSCTAIGLILALAFARWSKRPARTWVTTTVVLTVASMAGPITTGHATLATRLVLGLSHLPAAAIVIVAIARELERRIAAR